jgi:eukaryotic-like serine/threonine-protein kinase
MPSSRPADRDDVRTLLEQCVAAWHEHGPRAAEALLAATPELAAVVRDGLAALARAGLLDADAASELPDRIGGYRVLSLLGRGGMGAVFRAHDDTTGRDVAVKVVHPQLLWYGRARERFEREIRALARLAHRGAVAVYHFGDDGGVPFFVMEYVPGRSLAAILASVAGRDPDTLTAAALHLALRDRRPASAPQDAAHASADEPWWRAIVAIAIQIADTLQHAHQQQIVHRDVKPSNILVTPDGEARLVDFGLARIDGDAALTRAPTTIGSDPYMAPEQLGDRGGRADARSDVFSLGATLYEALALTPPFGSGGARTRERSHTGDFVPLRRTARSVPADLAAVCAVALDPEPTRRYPTAGAFADDLRAVLANRAVAARPIGPLARLWRLARRHPVTAAALALALVVSIAAPTWIAVQQYQASHSIGAALARAERNRDRAIDAIDRLLGGIAQGQLFQVPESEGVRRRLLQDAIELQEALLRDAPRDAQIAFDTAVAKRRLGELHRALGDTELADRCTEEALAILRTIPNVPAIEFARTLAVRGRSAGLRGDLATAVDDQREAIAALEQARAAVASPADRQRYERALAERRIDLAIAQGMQGDTDAAERGLEAAITALRRLPEDRNSQQAIGRALHNGIRAVNHRGDGPLAARMADAAIDAYGRALAHDPGDWELQALRANVQTTASKLAYSQEQLAAALVVGEAAHTTLATLQPQHSRIDWLTHHLAQAKLALADAYHAHDRRADARRMLDEAVGLLRELIRRDPGHHGMREALGRALGMAADLTRSAEEAVALLTEAQALFEAMHREKPDNPLAWRQLTVVYASRASLRRQADDLDGEARWLDVAIEASRPWHQKGLPPAREILSTLLLDRADCAARGDDPETAADCVREAKLLVAVRREHLAHREGLIALLDTPAYSELLR